MSQMSLGGGIPQEPITAEERQLKSERKRILAYVRQYERNPGSFNETMTAQVEKLALQYQVPFRRIVPKASGLQNTGAFLGGLADSVVFDLLPDKWYSSESTRTAKNVGKIGGAGAQIAAALALAPFTGGGSLALGAKGIGSAATAARATLGAASGLGKVGAGIKGLGTLGKGALVSSARGLAKLPVGRMTTGAINMGRGALQPYGVNKGWQWAKAAQATATRKTQAQVLKKARSAVANSGNLEEVVTGANLTKKQIASMTKMINRTYGKNSKVAKEYLKQLNTAVTSGPVNLQGLSPEQLINMANKFNAGWKVNSVNIKKIFLKAGINRPSKSQVKLITEHLKSKNITKLDDSAVKEIIKLAQKKGSTVLPDPSFADIDKWQALGSLGLGAGSLSMLNKREPSREEKEAAMNDPFNMQQPSL